MTWKAESRHGDTLFSNRRNHLPLHEEWCKKPEIIIQKYGEKNI